MNSNSIRRGIDPHLSAEDVNRLLWCCTPFPFRGDLRKLRRGIRHYLKAGGGVEGAIDIAHRELDEAWTAHQKRAELEAQEAA